MAAAALRVKICKAAVSFSVHKRRGGEGKYECFYDLI